MYARLLVELAAAGNSLYCWVFHNEYYTRVDKDFGEFRGVPLVLTDTLLDFIDVNLESGEDRTVLHFPYEMSEMTNPLWSVVHEPTRFDGGMELTCPDFVLCSSQNNVERGYQMFVGTSETPEFMPILFKSLGGAGTKRVGGRINWNEMQKK